MNKLSPLFLLALWMLSACTTPNTTEPTTPTDYNKPALERPVKNIILMVGDGMGLTQISAGMYQNGNRLNLERCTAIGLHKPYASNDLITDSAAGATAFACGIKTYNGAIGVDADTAHVTSILEEAEAMGKSTGLVATSTIVHATPASFIAHNRARKNYQEIAADFLNTEIDFFVGGGKKFFDRRDDERNLSKELEEKGYVVSDYFQQDFADVSFDFSKNFAYYTADADPLTVENGRDYLQGAAKAATVFLDNHGDKGFFLMVEGSQIDWGGHANVSEYIIKEMIDFDHTIGSILDFAEEDGNTLVIITADHETGGYAINPGSTMDTIVGAFTSDYHTGTLVPVFAYGPGSELFSGIYENTAIHTKMRQAFGFQ